MTGNIVAQAIASIASPVITRLYRPEDFGAMTLVWTYVGIFSVISCLNYENPIVLEKETSKAQSLFFLCIIVAISISFFFAIVISCFKVWIAAKIGLKDAVLLWFVPIGILAFGLNQATTYWFTRQKSFKLLAYMRVSTALIAAVTKIVFGLLLFSAGMWLLAGNILGPLISSLILIAFFLKANSSQLIARSRLKEMICMARKYSDFPRYNAPTRMLNTVSQNIPVVLFALYFSPEVVGYYGLANTILRKPINLMGQSLSKVFLQRMSVDHARGVSLRTGWMRTTIGLALMGILPFGILTIYGESIFSFVFGANWATAGIYCQILAPWLFMLFINPPSTQIIIVKQLLKFNMYFNISYLILRLIVIIITANIYHNSFFTIGAFSLIGILANIYYIFFAYHQTCHS